MRHDPIDPELFKLNRARLRGRLPSGSMAIVNANDIPPTNADGTMIMVPNSDLFYLTGVEQEASLLLIFPDAADPKLREILFIRDASPTLELWEGHKLSHEEAREVSGIQTIRSTNDFWSILRTLVLDANSVFLNTNEHKRAADEVPTRDLRFIGEFRNRYPLHSLQRLAPILSDLRLVKSEIEIELTKRACRITKQAFERALKATKPGATEADIEAEYAHEFIRNRARFAYSPIVAGGRNNCVLHYLQNDQPLKDSDLLLLDVGSAYANYNSDLTRTIPVNGAFTPRQREIYDAALRVMRQMIAHCVPGVRHRKWQLEAERLVEEELLQIGLLNEEEIQNQDPEKPALKKYFMHGLGHPLGLDVHDVGDMARPFEPGWILTVEPGIYLPDEGFGVRLENDVLVTAAGPVDLMEDIPVEADHIEDLMRSSR